MPSLPRLLPTVTAVPARAAGRVRRWAEESNQGSRRNAMVAATALAQRRAELLEVEELLDPQAPTGSAGRTAGREPGRTAHG